MCRALTLFAIGAYFVTSVMTFRYNTVALVYTTSRTKMPTLLREIPRLLPKALQHCYNASKITKSTLEYLNSVLDEDVEEKDITFLPSYEPAVDSANKKRKKSVV